MPRLNIRIDNYGQPTTVSQMRRRLAQILSKLSGDQEIKFTFTAVLEDYQPVRVLTKSPLLGMPYGPTTTVHQIEAEENDPYTAFGKLARPEND
jgi:hypothetical protein